MRSVSAAVTAAQRADSLIPSYKIQLTLDANDDTYEEDRILEISHTEEAFHGVATVVLDNSDLLVTADYKGYQGVISYGVNRVYSAGATAPMIVVDQLNHSSEGVLVVTLTLQGLTDHIAQDHASGPYTIERGDTRTVKAFITAVLGATLPPFSHTLAFTATYDSEDSLIDAFTPQDLLSIGVNDTRLSIIQRLLFWTKNVMRVEDDGAFHFRNPTVSGGGYDYSYELDVGGEHDIFAKATRTRLVMPNRIVVTGHPDAKTQFYGEAEFTDSSDLTNMEKTEYIYAYASTNAQAALVAEAVLQNYKLDAQRGSAEVPLNVGQEVHDWILLTDSRQGDTRAGNIGSLIRTAGDGRWTMRFAFGSVAAGGFLGLTPPRSIRQRSAAAQAIVDAFMARQPGAELDVETLTQINAAALQEALDRLENAIQVVFANQQALLALINGLGQQVQSLGLNSEIDRLHVREYMRMPVGTDKFR